MKNASKTFRSNFLRVNVFIKSSSFHWFANQCFLRFYPIPFIFPSSAKKISKKSEGFFHFIYFPFIAKFIGKCFLQLLDFPFTKNIDSTENPVSSYQQSETHFASLALFIYPNYLYIFSLLNFFPPLPTGGGIFFLR